MTIKNMYTYLGTNGTITSPVFLENIYSVKQKQLIADDNKILVKNGEVKGAVVLVSADENLENWQEVNI